MEDGVAAPKMKRRRALRAIFVDAPAVAVASGVLASDSRAIEKPVAPAEDLSVYEPGYNDVPQSVEMELKRQEDKPVYTDWLGKEREDQFRQSTDHRDLFERKIDVIEKIHTDRQEFVNKQRELRALRKKDINSAIDEAYPGVLPPFDSIPGIVAARKIPDKLERVASVVAQLGVETKDEIEGALPTPVSELPEEFQRLADQATQLQQESQVVNQKLQDDTLSQEVRARLHEELMQLYRQEWRIHYVIELERVRTIATRRYSRPDVNACNIYATDVMAALGMNDVISHRIDNNGSPVTKGGIELHAGDMGPWLGTFGTQKHGWTEVTDLSYDEKRQLLSQGNIFYGTSGGHNWVVFGMKDDTGECIPVLSQATFNYMMEYLPPTNHKITGIDSSELTNIRIFSHKIPD